MDGAISPLILAKVILLIAWKCLLFAAPFLAVVVLWWLVNQTDRIISYLFPHLEWEKSLGWLDIRSERRAKTALRWMGYGIYLLLAAALLGISWAAEGLQAMETWSDPWSIGNSMLRGATLVVCLGAWVLYLGVWLMPKLRAEREEAELKKFRVEMADAEAEAEERRKMHGPSRVHSPLTKPRKNAAVELFMADRARKRR